MKTVGQRKLQPIAFQGSGKLLAEGARFNDEIHRLPTGRRTFIRKGVYRFKTHEEANRHDVDCIAAMMAEIALERRFRRPSAAMQQYSRPATLEDLKVLIRALDEHGADYLLIGGYALFVHGYHRSTVDIDILVQPSEDVGRKLRSALMLLPDQAARDIDPSWFTEGENIRITDEFVVDVMFNAGGKTYDTLKEHAESIDVDGLPIRTVNLEGLLRTKRSMREKNIADRIVIERALDALRKREADR